MSNAFLKGRDFLSMADLTPEELTRLLVRAQELKAGACPRSLQGKAVALLFEKPSLRTRVSFDVATSQLGGHPLYLSREEVGLGTREPIADVARVLSRMVDALAIRTFAQKTLEEMAQHAEIPVINALSDQEHPCQALGDLFTILEKKGSLDGVAIAYVGDGNNVAASLALGAALVGASFFMAAPPGYGLRPDVVDEFLALGEATGANLIPMSDPREALRGADVVYTDVWTSMGQEAQAKLRRRAFAPYQVNEALLELASPDVIFMHPMPAHPGEEIPDGFLEHPSSVTFDQAENRLHAQKALLEAILAD